MTNGKHFLRIKKQQEREAKLAEIEEFNANAIAFQSEIDKFFANAKETHHGLTQKVNRIILFPTRNLKLIGEFFINRTWN